MNRRHFFARFAALAAGFVAVPKAVQLSGVESPSIPISYCEYQGVTIYASRFDENLWKFTKEQLGIT